MKAKILIILFVSTLYAFNVYSQIYDDFSDNNLYDSPKWAGNIKHFCINKSQQLQLNATKAGKSSIAFQGIYTQDIEWKLFVQLNFKPSESNQLLYWLNTDIPVCNKKRKGIYLHIGENGDNDTPELIYTDGEEKHIILRLKDGLANNKCQFYINIKYLDNHRWELWLSDSKYEALTLKASAEYQLPKVYKCTSIECHYTKSNATDFIFDDIYNGAIIVDNTSPKVIDYDIISINNVLLTFSESLDKRSAINYNNYTITDNNIHPDTIRLEGLSNNKVKLIFNTPLAVNKHINLNVKEVEDLFGNEMESHNIKLYYPLAQKYDIIISEIMFDPTPSVLLPPYEYIELYNRSDIATNLQNWTLNIGDKSLKLPDSIIKPKEFMILCNSGKAYEQLKAHLPDINITAVPSFSLPNDRNQLSLFNTVNQEVHSTTWDVDFHQSKAYKEGGYSLEIIDINNPCWKKSYLTSCSDKGGSPGFFTTSEINEEMKASIQDLIIEEKNLLTFDINFHIDKEEDLYPEDFSFTPDDIQVKDCLFNEDSYRYELYLNNKIQESKIYNISIDRSIYNCIQEKTIINYDSSFVLPSIALENDITINEIMFNPIQNKPEYIELYNNSENIIDLSKISIGYASGSAEILSYSQLCENKELIYPDMFALLSSDTAVILGEIQCNNHDVINLVSPIRSLNNTAAKICLKNEVQTTIDYFEYNESLHHHSLYDLRGVALEKISSCKLSYISSNWTSASRDSNFNTPACVNSQSLISSEKQDKKFKLLYDEISPNNDGYHDFLIINYQLNKGNFNINSTIYDLNGNKIKEISNNELSSSQGSIIWDCKSDFQTVCKKGIYIIIIQAADNKNNKYLYKDAFAII
ncbi:MAG: lamin tail domain-containing protein [Hyphomicrobiales bacterium]